jgi:tripeptidyl-peptidase-1
VHYQNGTQADGAIKFDPFTVKAGSGFYRANATQVLGGTTYYGLAQFENFECYNFEFFKDEARHSLAFLLEHGGNPPPPPPPGTCEIYSAVTAHGPSADPNVVSGGSAISPTKPPVLWPSWPASSPWVTAVGATRYTEQKIGNPEMATDQFGSGGGFSLQFGQSPDATYQSAAVANYLATVDKDTLPPAGSFPPMGRATPDVSALGEGYQVIVHGKAESVGGTSASSPAFAGMVSLLNEARLAKGGKQMGFLNPFLYKNAAAFTSIDLGSNKVGRQMQSLPFGFNCSKGWDPATGLGTPQFQKLLAAATAGN